MFLLIISDIHFPISPNLSLSGEKLFNVGYFKSGYESENTLQFCVFDFRILIRAAEGILVKGDGEIQKLALQVLCNCVCAPKKQVLFVQVKDQIKSKLSLLS